MRGAPDARAGPLTPPVLSCRVDRHSKVRATLPVPAKGSLPLPAERPAGLDFVPGWGDLPFSGTPVAPPQREPRSVLEFKGGETEGLKRLKYYLWDSDLASTYFDTRNGMIGGDYSTKFSAWLALGCLSPRLIYHELQKYETQRVANKSTAWIVFELKWRDYFKFFAMKHGNAIFFEEGTAGLELPWSYDRPLFERWRDGKTGVPLIDANMRELAATGFMSNRGRQNVASYLALDMGVDWRRGADLFESLQIDYDVASSWGNWVAAAGLTGGRINRFNPIKQSNDYDPKGEYIRLWLPELAKVDNRYIFEPHKMPKEVAEASRFDRCLRGTGMPVCRTELLAIPQAIGFKIGVTYPAPIPASQMAGRAFQRPGDGDFSSGGRGGGSGRGGRGGRGGYGGGRGGGRGDRPRSAYDRFG